MSALLNKTMSTNEVGPYKTKKSTVLAVSHVSVLTVAVDSNPDEGHVSYPNARQRSSLEIYAFRMPFWGVN